VTFAARGSPPGGEGGPPELSSFGGVDCSESAPKTAPAQEHLLRNPRAVREATIASILDESHWLLGDLALQVSVARQFVELRDARGYLYCLDLVVKQAICIGAEGIALREIRTKMREERRS
jgi:hypothetical protein